MAKSDVTIRICRDKKCDACPRGSSPHQVDYELRCGDRVEKVCWRRLQTVLEAMEAQALS